MSHKTIAMKRSFIILSVLLYVLSSMGQSTADYAVQLTAGLQESPPTITLSWVNDANATGYILYRKLKEDNSWGSAIASLNGTATQFTDTTVSIGVSYEYKVNKTAGNYSGYGYINSGIKVPAIEQRGRMILVVDSTAITGLITELQRLEYDLTADGWTVLRHDVDRNDSVPDVKAIIINDYNADPANTKAVFLFGHVPVPYSGNINPDGHPNHQGAWPADVYYGDINGNWTDNSVNNTIASDPRNDNVPGDGKFDQSIIPSNIELEVGRVDMANMPAFTQTEEELLKRYLDKDHLFRTKQLIAQERALIDDNFGAFGGEAFASTGWRNFATLVGYSNITSQDYFTTMSANSYLWSYGCGGGSYTSANGIGNTSNFATDSLQCIFTVLFGSYFGDWDHSDNFLRAPLASGATLTNFWAGRPHWHMHHMAMGENIGYSTRLSQNNNNLYIYNYGGRFVHVALMGDPSLRMHIIAAPQNLLATVINDNQTSLVWDPSPDTVLGYYIYRKDTSGDFLRLNTAIIPDTFYLDSCVAHPMDYIYMVRAIKLETSPSGSYYNLSPGIFDTVTVTNDMSIVANYTYQETLGTVDFTDLSTNNPNAWFWDFDDSNTDTQQNPSHVYSTNGTYNVMLVASNTCTIDTIYKSVIVTGVIGVEEQTADDMLNIYPNPNNGFVKVLVNTGADIDGTLQLLSPDGKLIMQKNFTCARQWKTTLDLTEFPKGIYFLKMTDMNGLSRVKKIICR